MDEEPQGNLDSFVDIVANTAGVMIVLVIMSLMSSDEAGGKHNVNKIALKDLTARETGVLMDIAKMDEEQLQKDYDGNIRHRRRSLAEMKLGSVDLQRLPEILKKTQDENAADKVALDKMTVNRDEVQLRLDAEKVKVAQKFTQEEIDILSEKKVEDMKSALTNIRSGMDGLREEIKKLAARKADFEKEAAALENEVEVLAAQGGDTIEISDAPSKLERVRQPVWVECYVPKTALDTDGVIRPCVRLVSVKGYAKKVGKKDSKEKTLRLDTAGESTFGILEPDSAFQTFLKNYSGKKDGLYLMFIVQPDAYSAFRLARKIARDGGWRVDWRPLKAGGRTAFPGMPPPATTSLLPTIKVHDLRSGLAPASEEAGG